MKVNLLLPEGCPKQESIPAFARDALKKDLELDTILNAVAGRDGFILEALTEKRWEKLLVHLGRSDVDLSALPSICGFRSAAALRELFRRRTGMSMTEWRKRNGGRE